ncbi:hypothetical protein Tco_0137909 [Tanacetum coccineum]
MLPPLQPHRTRILIEDVAPVAHETPSESSSKENDVQDSKDVANKESEQDLQDELEKWFSKNCSTARIMFQEHAFEEKGKNASQKKAAQATSTNKLSTDRQSVSTDRPSISTDRTFVSTARSFVSTDRSKTSYISASSIPTGANAGESSFVYLGGKIPIDASTLPNADLPIDQNMLDFKDAFDTLPNDGIFNGAYDDDEDVGAVTDFNNMDNTIAVSPIPTLKIHKDHPKGQILRDPKSTVQTRGKIQKASSAQQALEKGAAMDQGNASGSAKANIQLKELMVLVPSLVTRALEEENQEGECICHQRVKNQRSGRIKPGLIDDAPLVSLVRESMKEKSVNFVTPTKASGEAQEEEISPTILEAAKTLSKVASQSVSKAKSTDKGKRYRRRARLMPKNINIGLDTKEEINTDRVEINTGIEDVNTGSTKIDTSRTSISTSSIIPSPKKGQKERKAQMVEEDI